jgi:hypothetical protein
MDNYNYEAYDAGFEAGKQAMLSKYETLKKLLEGQWVDCKAVQDALDITFAEGLRMFEFGRIAKWCPAPMNGQKIITKFKLSEKTILRLEDHALESAEDVSADNKLGYL